MMNMGEPSIGKLCIWTTIGQLCCELATFQAELLKSLVLTLDPQHVSMIVKKIKKTVDDFDQRWDNQFHNEDATAQSDLDAFFNSLDQPLDVGQFPGQLTNDTHYRCEINASTEFNTVSLSQGGGQFASSGHQLPQTINCAPSGSPYSPTNVVALSSLDPPPNLTIATFTNFASSSFVHPATNFANSSSQYRPTNFSSSSSVHTVTNFPTEFASSSSQFHPTNFASSSSVHPTNFPTEFASSSSQFRPTNFAKSSSQYRPANFAGSSFVHTVTNFPTDFANSSSQFRPNNFVSSSSMHPATNFPTNSADSSFAHPLTNFADPSFVHHPTNFVDSSSVYPPTNLAQSSLQGRGHVMPRATLQWTLKDNHFRGDTLPISKHKFDNVLRAALSPVDKQKLEEAKFLSFTFQYNDSEEPRPGQFEAMQQGKGKAQLTHLNKIFRDANAKTEDMASLTMISNDPLVFQLRIEKKPPTEVQ